MVDVKTKGVNDAFKRLSKAALTEADSERNCTVNADDLSTILMAYTMVTDNHKPKPDFSQQLADAVAEAGLEETFSCMARFMCGFAFSQQAALEFDCDLGALTIEPKELPAQRH